LLDKYQIYDPETIKRLPASTKAEQKRLSTEFGISDDDLEELVLLIKKIEKDGNIRLIPAMMSKAERDSFVAGKLAMDDITMDLESKAGRDAVAKLYIPLVMKIASQFEGKSAFDKDQLIGSGMLGLVNAMNNWRKPETTDIDSLDIDDADKREGQKVKSLSFKKYAAWRIRFQILSDINKYSRTVTMSQYTYRKLRDEGRVGDTFVRSIDTGGQDDENGSSTDRMPELGQEPDVFRPDQDATDKNFAELYEIIEKKFGFKEASIFYRILGLNGFKRVPARTIASEMGVTENRISQIKNKIISYLRANKRSARLLADILDVYTENLLFDLYNCSKEEIYEALISDDVHMMLEAATRWDSKDKLSRSVSNALEAMADTTKADYIVHCLRDGFDYIDSTYRKNKLVIMEFLSILEPTETFGKRSDAFIIDRISEISEMCQKHGIYSK
jgi:RNA polymerase sigma factor (sigma-70 family)